MSAKAYRTLFIVYALLLGFGLVACLRANSAAGATLFSFGLGLDVAAWLVFWVADERMES